jgi:hypothetical protein
MKILGLSSHTSLLTLVFLLATTWSLRAQNISLFQLGAVDYKYLVLQVMTNGLTPVPSVRALLAKELKPQSSSNRISLQLRGVILCQSAASGVSAPAVVAQQTTGFIGEVNLELRPSEKVWFGGVMLEARDLPRTLARSSLMPPANVPAPPYQAPETLPPANIAKPKTRKRRSRANRHLRGGEERQRGHPLGRT